MKKLNPNAPIGVGWSVAEAKTLNIMAYVLGLSVSDYVRGKMFPLSEVGERYEAACEAGLRRAQQVMENEVSGDV